MRIFIASLGTETNTFSPLPTGRQTFEETLVAREASRHADHFAALPARTWRRLAEADGHTVVESLSAFAQPGGRTVRAVWEGFRDEILADLRAAVPVDAVLLFLHGAMVAEGYDDCEGDLLARVRAIVGPSVVVGAELDPHCHLSEAMVRHADVLVCFKEYPHTDILERAEDLLELCAGRAAGRVRPVPAVYDCGMVALLHTSREPVRGFVDRIKAMEGRDGILSISIAHGFPWGDVPDMGTKVLVYADGDPALAARVARELGEELVAMRERLSPGYPRVDEALDLALACVGRPVVLADSADNPGGGAAGDSTFVLRRLLERGIGDALLGPLWDPIAVSLCFEAGEGARIPLRIGGKIGPTSGDPVDAHVRVRALRRDASMTGLSGTRAPLGDCALVDVAGVGVLLNTTRTQALGTDLFTQFGCDLAATRIVVVKSSQHFHAAFGPIAARVVYVETPGSVTQDLRSLPFRNILRPKWPL